MQTLTTPRPAPSIEAGLALLQQGRLAEAATVYRQILDVQPDHADALHLLGLVAYHEGRYDAAVDLMTTALTHHTSEIFYGNLGNAFAAQGKRAAAIECFRQAIALKSDYVHPHNNLGNLLREQGELAEAVRCFRTVIALQPDYAEGHNNLANALVDIGDLNAAIDAYRRAIALKPDLLEARSNLLFILSYREDLSQVEYHAEAIAFGRVATAKAKPWRDWRVSLDADTRRGPLRVGLVSGDLKIHPTGHFLESILAHVDRSRIEFIAYPTRRAQDALTERIRPYFCEWTPLASMNDEQAATRIRDDRIDVLLDLSGHMNFNRLALFAWRPAPVQASWLGYFASTGLPAIDYLLGDRHVLPPGEQAYYTERLRRLPDSYLCFTPPSERVDIGPLPLATHGHVTFGCFNHLMKMNDGVVDVWARILHAVPRSRLFLKAKQLDDAPTREATLARFAARGIDGSRLTLEGRSPRAEYLAAYNRIDIALSPFPYPGGTTSVEGLWMGVPVLCRRGDRFLSNICTSMLHSAGLRDWIAETNDEYVAKAVAFASDERCLAAMRANLRPALLASPLCDAARYARHLEDALESMWRDGIARSMRSMRSIESKGSTSERPTRTDAAAAH